MMLITMMMMMIMMMMMMMTIKFISISKPTSQIGGWIPRRWRKMEKSKNGKQEIDVSSLYVQDI